MNLVRCLPLAVFTFLPFTAADSFAGRTGVPHLPTLQRLVDRAVAKTVATFAGQGLPRNQLDGLRK